MTCRDRRCNERRTWNTRCCGSPATPSSLFLLTTAKLALRLPGTFDAMTALGVPDASFTAWTRLTPVAWPVHLSGVFTVAPHGTGVISGHAEALVLLRAAASCSGVRSSR